MPTKKPGKWPIPARMGLRIIPISILLASVGHFARADVTTDPCAAISAAADATFSIALKDGRTVFEQGEIVPLVLTFSSTAKGKYWADARNYDRSGRLTIERYCITPAAPDPLESYFRVGGFMGGGLGNDELLSDKAFTANAELNEWLSPAAGHYRLYAISYRVWTIPDPAQKTQFGREGVVLRSNAVEFDVKPANSEWQAQQLNAALKTLHTPASSDEKKHAARVLRFINSEDSARALAREFYGLNELQAEGWDLMFGLFGSPFRQLTIDAMKAEMPAPEHAITNDFMNALVKLEMSGDARWTPPGQSAKPDEWQSFMQKYQAGEQETMRSETEEVLKSLPAKTGRAKALTVEGLIMDSGKDRAAFQKLRPQLVSVWNDLPAHTRDELIQYRWELIGGPQMMPILREIVSQPAPSPRTMPAMTRDAALEHIYELDKNAGIELIEKDLLDEHAQPSMRVIGLLTREEIAKALPAAVDRIAHQESRERDFDLVESYADVAFLSQMQSAFEAHIGGWGCAPQSDMLRYFLRVAPEYGAKQVEASLAARKTTGCYRFLLQELGDELPEAGAAAIAALNDADSEVAQDAALALGHWGMANAEPALWQRLEKFHSDWAGRVEEMKRTAPFSSPGSQAVGLEQNLVIALAGGTGWLCPPEKLERLEALAVSGHEKEMIEAWIKRWKDGPAVIEESWIPEDRPMFSVLQYEAMNFEQLKVKVAQFPPQTKLKWHLLQPSQGAPQTAIDRQQRLYVELQAVAGKNSVVIEKTN